MSFLSDGGIFFASFVIEVGGEGLLFRNEFVVWKLGGVLVRLNGTDVLVILLLTICGGFSDFVVVVAVVVVGDVTDVGLTLIEYLLCIGLYVSSAVVVDSSKDELVFFGNYLTEF